MKKWKIKNVSDYRTSDCAKSPKWLGIAQFCFPIKKKNLFFSFFFPFFFSLFFFCNIYSDLFHAVFNAWAGKWMGEGGVWVGEGWWWGTGEGGGVGGGTSLGCWQWESTLIFAPCPVAMQSSAGNLGGSRAEHTIRGLDGALQRDDC